MYVIAHAPKRGLIAGRGQHGQILVWSDSTFDQVASFNCAAMDHTIESLAFSPDETQLVTVDTRGALNRIHVGDWKIEASNRDLDLAAEQIIYSPSGDTLLLRGGGQVYMFDPFTLDARGQLKLDGTTAVGPIVFDDGGQLLLWKRGSSSLFAWPSFSSAPLPSIEHLQSE